MKRSKAGPRHQTEMASSSIAGVELQSMASVHYEYGTLSEIFRTTWPTIFAEPIEHLYVIKNHPSQRNIWHLHEHTVDRYVLLDGELELALFDARPQSETYGSILVLALGSIDSGRPAGVRIPAGVWHTFRSENGPFMLLNAKTPPFRSDFPDKLEIGFDESPINFHWD